MLTIGVLCSGELGLKTLKRIDQKHDVCFVLTDAKSVAVQEYSAVNEIPVFAGNPRMGKGYLFIKSIPVDVIISINYLYLIEKDIIDHSNKITFNVHGSLLPKFRGRTPHVWAIIKGETQTGITAHLIDEGCDTGAVLRHVVVPIEKNDTGGMILEKYSNLYPLLIDSVLTDVKKDSLQPIAQDESQATFFGKRTPADGGIDWSWNKEQIRNWIRAQAFPYPGAFTFYDKEKVILDRVSTLDFQSSVAANGEIVQVVPKVVVKVEDGFVILEDIRTENHNFEIGKKFTNEDRP